MYVLDATAASRGAGIPPLAMGDEFAPQAANATRAAVAKNRFINVFTPSTL